ncbi:F-box/LRR-repeat protein [Trifolium medium]|uniref:F-box/LRR-repeat protein n=1 Tax=Trifolium medium TaxID=97028 RepID=A0A392QY59_9FABA|nr:F-box/LRR-repeat protein [Trifolium medium]
MLQIFRFPLNLKSLNLSNQLTIHVKGLRAFSRKITTLTSLACSDIASLHSTDMFVIADYFPLLEELNLSCPTEVKDHSNFLTRIKALSTGLSNLHER